MLFLFSYKCDNSIQGGTAKGHEGVTESNFGGWGEYWIKSCCVVEVTYEMYHEV